MTRRRGAWAGALAAAAVVLAAGEAAADWPMSRHDARRTAMVTTGKGNLTAPVPAWKFYTGGAVGFASVVTGDVDGDGLPEILFLQGSSFVGTRLDGTTLWETPLINGVAVKALADLDGDGVPELLVRLGLHQVAVLDGLTGVVDWLEPSTEIGIMGTILLHDLDGDGLPDLLLEDCGCCGAMGTVPGAVYSFAGNVQQPKLLWQLPYAACGGATTTTILDAEGNGGAQVLLGRAGGFDLLDGPSGKIVASTAAATQQPPASCVPAKITGSAAEQAVCLYDAATTDDSGHRVLAIGYTPTPSPALTVLWDQKIGAVDNGVAYAPGLVADLDGDGKPEVTVAAQDDASTWSTHVLDAATGTELGLISGHKLAGVAPVLPGGRSLVLTGELAGTAAWTFDRAKTPPIAQSFMLAGQSPILTPDYDLSLVSVNDKALVMADFTGDGVDDLVVTGAGGTLQILDLTGPMPVPVASAAPPANGGLEWMGAVDLMGKPGLVGGWNDGFFRAYNGALTVVNPPGAQMAGYWATAYLQTLDPTIVAGALVSGGPDAVLFTDAAGTLHALDASHADMKTPPVERWALPQTTGPVILPAGTSPAVVAIQQVPQSNPATHQIVGLGPDGSTVWTAPLAGITLTDLVTGNLDGDGVPDVLVQWGATADNAATLRNRAISGASGATIWDGKTFGPPNGSPAGASAADWNGDGVDDLFLQNLGTHVLSGKDGSEIGAGTTEMAPACMPVVFDVNGDGADEIVLQAGETVVRELSHDLTKQLYASTDTQATILYGALAQCPGGTRLVEGTYFYHTARLTLTDFAAQTATTMILAGGQSFPDEMTAQASGAVLGVLTAVSVHQNLSGQGHPSAVLGSTDGWLYSVNPCTGDLEYSVAFKNAVGSVAFADTDGDGLDEILVECADGYLYDLKQPVQMGTGGAGGTGGGATGGGGTGGQGGNIELPIITGRATCACDVPGRDAEGMLGVSVGCAAVALATARRRVRRRR